MAKLQQVDVSLAAREGIETHSSKGLNAAVRMAKTTVAAEKSEQRKVLSATLVRASRDLGAYIINKRLAKRAS